MTSKSNIWLCATGVFLLVALAFLAPVSSVNSQELQPLFDASECTPVLDGYVDDGHSAAPGAIVCKYHRQQSSDPLLGNWSSLWLTYYPSAEAATAWIQENYLTDEHLRTYSCAAYDDCDKIERALLEQTESSFWGYTMQVDAEPSNISMQRRFVYGTYAASIFVQGRAFESLGQAEADVLALEQLARRLVDAPREMVAPAQSAATGTPGATAEATAGPHEGKSCRQYCEDLDSPLSKYVGGETYPDCDCACSQGKIYIDGTCASCETACAGADKYAITPLDGECSCLCKDPAKTWDRSSGECVEGEDRAGMACSEYCDLVDPGTGWPAPGSGETYPDCNCWCEPIGDGAVYINGLCVPCQSACTGDDVFLIQPSDGPCRCQCRDDTKTWDQATGQCIPAPDKTGMACVECCAQLGPGAAVPIATSGETYPDCQCQCQDDAGRQYSFFENQCVPCTEMCRGEGMSVFTQKGGACSCLCNDPQKKWDRASGLCVPLDGTECNSGNGCQPELGENCANCPDCGCTIVSQVDPQLSQAMTCQPEHPQADVRGCVVVESETGSEEQLETQEAQWRECRDAWALMNLSNLQRGEPGSVATMSNLANFPQVAHWQRQCNCTPVGGVVVGNEAADPMVCLMRCCDRLLDGIDAQALRIKGIVPVVRGPGIKIRPTGAEVEIMEGQAVRIEGSVDLWGDRANPLVTTFGIGSPRSQYEVLHRPGEGMEVYLYEGQYTHTYYDSVAGVVKQEEIASGQMLSIGPDGVPVSRSSFEAADRDPWWLDQPYYVECPDGAYQEGADCYCGKGYETDPVRDVCVPVLAWSREAQPDVGSVATSPPPLVEITVTPALSHSGEDWGLDINALVVILAIIVGAILVALGTLIATFLIKR